MSLSFLSFAQLNIDQLEGVRAKWPADDAAGYEYSFHQDGVTPYVRRTVTKLPTSKTEALPPAGDSETAEPVVVNPPPVTHAGPAGADDIREVPLWLIDDSLTQPRTVYDSQKHEELRKSMVAHGWLKTHALLLRPKAGPACVAAPVDPENDAGNYVILHPETRHPLLPQQFARGDAEMIVRGNSCRFERIFGHRRSRAAIAANIVVAPAVIQALSDVEVMELQLVEGLKEELNPIDEAEHVKRLLALRAENGKPVHTAETAAVKVGKDADYLRKVVLLAELEGEAREAIAEGRLGVSLGYLIGAIPNAEARSQAAHGILHPQQGVGPLSRAAASDYIRRDFTRDLRKAPFDTADAELRPPAPACVSCAFNSNFSTEVVPGRHKLGICGNIACYRAKEEVEWERWRAAHHQPENGRIALSRERCAEIFEDDEVNWKTGLVDLAAAPHSSVLRDPDKFAEGPQQSWAELTQGRLTEILVARDPKGRKRELVQLESAKASAELNAHLIFKTSPATRVERTRNGADESQHQEAVLEQKSDDQAKQDETKEYNLRVTNRLLNDLDGKVRAIGHLTPAIAHLLLRWVVDLQLSGMGIVEDCRATDRGMIAEVLAGSDEKENLGALVQLMVANYYAQSLDETAEEILDELGVSLQGAANAVKAEMALEKEKAAEAAAPKEPKKKKGKKKAEPPTANEAAALPANWGDLLDTAKELFGKDGIKSAGALADAMLIDISICYKLVDSIINEKFAAAEPLPTGCHWVSEHLAEPFDWNTNGVCTNPEVLKVDAAGKKEKTSLLLSVGRHITGLWYFGFDIETRNGGMGSPVSLDGLGYPDKASALRDGAAFLSAKVAGNEKVSEKTRERCYELARTFGTELKTEAAA